MEEESLLHLRASAIIPCTALSYSYLTAGMVFDFLLKGLNGSVATSFYEIANYSVSIGG